MAIFTKFYNEYKKYNNVSYKEMNSEIGSIENELNRMFIRTDTEKINITNDEYDLLISLLPQKEVVEVDEIAETRYSNDYIQTEEEKEIDREFYQKELEKEIARENRNKKRITNYKPTKNTTCPRCNGTGKVNFAYANGICFKCMGTGKI